MNKKTIIFISLIIISFLIPIMTNEPFTLHILMTLFIAMSAAAGLGLLMSGGMISLAHAGIMAIGAYSSALLVTQAGFSFWLALPLSGLIAAVLGLLITYPVLRLKGLYFIMVTFAINEIIRLFIINGPEVLGGHTGMTMIPRPDSIAILGLPVIEFTSKVPYYYLILVILLINLYVIYRIYASRFGKALKAINENDALAKSIGINVMQYKAIAFGIICFFAGLDGSFYVHYMRLAAPQFFTIWVSIYYIIYAQVGGHATIFGPLFGAAFFSLIPEFLREMAQWSPIVFGGLLVLAIMFLPGGLETLPQKAKSWIQRRHLPRKSTQGAGEEETHGSS